MNQDWEKFIEKISVIKQHKGIGFFNGSDTNNLYSVINSGKYTCLACGGSGSISAKRKKAKPCEATYSFMCQCEFGKFLRWNIPQWSSSRCDEFEPVNKFHSVQMKAVKVDYRLTERVFEKDFPDLKVVTKKVDGIP